MFRKEIKMFNTKLLASILIILAVMFAQVGNVAAAPQTQDGTTTTINGTIQEITTELDANGETVVIVKVLNDQGTVQTVTLSAQEAADNQLYDLTTGELLAKKDDSVELVVDPNAVVTDEEPVEPDVHPLSMLLAKFFFGGEDDLGQTYEMASLIDSFHTGDNEADQVFGFGVIAQALWMSKSLNDGTADANLAEEILVAKRTGDYSAFELPDGSSPANWGQFKKALRDNKEKHNLGVIVSGQGEDSSQDSTLQQDKKDNGKSNTDKDHGKGKDKKQKKHP
jgi:hypothetical protein